MTDFTANLRSVVSGGGGGREGEGGGTMEHSWAKSPHLIKDCMEQGAPEAKFLVPDWGI